MSKGPRSRLGINAQNDKVFCFQDILSELLFKVRAGARLWDGDGDGFRVGVRASIRWTLSFIHRNPNLRELRLCPGVKT